MYNFGHFTERGTFVITTPGTPRPQENFLFNQRYFTCVHQTGNGFSRYTDPSGHSISTVTGVTQPMENGISRVIYVRDDETGEYWNPGYYPVCTKYSDFECEHEPGVTTVRSTTNGICSEWTIFVPPGTDPVEIWSIRLSNRSERTRRLSVFSVADISLASDAATYGVEIYRHSGLLPEVHGVFARRPAMDLPFPNFAAVALSEKRPTSIDSDRIAFMHQFRTYANPHAVVRGECSGSIASMNPIVAAVHHRIELDVEGKWSNHILVGSADVDGYATDAERLFANYLADDAAGATRALPETRMSVIRYLDRVRIQTADDRLNRLYNQWVPWLNNWGFASGRWGMMGYRDIVQQTQGHLMYGEHERDRFRILQAFENQFQSGYSVRSYPAVHEDSHMKYADSSMWLVSTVCEYVKETGDVDLLKRQVSFLDGGSDTVMDHVRRTLDALSDGCGEHGLCLIHQGDWNDSLTHVGRAGRGESVWLSQAFCYVAEKVRELSEFAGLPVIAAECVQRYVKMKDNLNRHAWSGDRYIRAFDDHGEPIGCGSTDAGRMYLNTQSWALMSNTVPLERIGPMLRAVDRELRTPFGYLLLYPTYLDVVPNVGRISCIEPGCCENASVYTHGNAFFAIGLLMHGFAAKGYEVLRLIMPDNPENPSEWILPYQLSNGYHGVDHRNNVGKTQYGWTTGSGAWLHQCVVEYLIGLRRTYHGLTLNPCLPHGFGPVAVRRTYRGCKYEVEIEPVREGASPRLVVDGREHPLEKPLPIETDGTVRVKLTSEY